MSRLCVMDSAHNTYNGFEETAARNAPEVCTPKSGSVALLGSVFDQKLPVAFFCYLPQTKKPFSWQFCGDGDVKAAQRKAYTIRHPRVQSSSKIDMEVHLLMAVRQRILGSLGPCAYDYQIRSSQHLELTIDCASESKSLRQSYVVRILGFHDLNGGTSVQGIAETDVEVTLYSSTLHPPGFLPRSRNKTIKSNLWRHLITARDGLPCHIRRIVLVSSDV
ncbi:LOW QUALITY PROTEIN: hypothetical protein CVT26_010267 [Gymnopilus dilepis]|uniref:Uncharacterized protein n=1 Tax=Gymnopilus dilepis TaxID=231916 RepID=A0A409Y137_9AGAR|nr:LOW QUALITY PROTEIN: hypothetical protein CVT26_010267 [Gymnopilus dilepis]